MKKWLKRVLPLVGLVFPNLKLDGKQKLQLSDEDKSKLDTETKQEGFAEAFMDAYNKLMVVDEDTEAAYNGFMEEYKKEMAAQGIEASETEDVDEADKDTEVPKGDAGDQSAQINQLVQAGQNILSENKELKGQLETMKNKSEEDEPEIIPAGTTTQTKVKHSKTHLFGSGHGYDSLDRPWNKRVIDSIKKGISVSGSTVWDKVNIDKLNSDLQDYSRRNSAEIMSMILDGYDVPAHWPIVSNVQDQYVFSSIATGEITQAFKKSWLPKNKQRFVPVINKIFDKQIDIEWQASELKSIEKSWLNMFFNEGSTPYKMSFARYLLGEILKRARKEDKINMFKGVYSDPANLPAGTAGSFLNAMDGFLKLILKHRGVDYLPHDVEPLTPINTYTVLQTWFENQVPIDVRNMPNLKLGLGNDALRHYHESREQLKGTNTDYSATSLTLEKFPNVEFVGHAQLEGTGFFYLTTEDNIGIMVDRPGEESLLTIETTRREIHVFADYKHGLFFKAFGAKVDPNADLDYEDQIFFSNNVELLNDTYVPVAAGDATPSVAEHHALVIGENNTAAVNITKLDDIVEGKTYVLRGNSDTTPSTLVNNANNVLDGGDFELGNGDEIVLIGISGDRVIEFSRTEAGSVAEPEKVALAADATTADAANGTIFVTAANAGATVLTNIENAIAGEEYTIEGGSDTNSTTIANGGNFLLGAAFTAGLGAFLKVKYNGSKFIEVARG